MFIAALFTIAKTWKQSKFPSMDKWIKKIGTYIQWNMSHKKELNHVICSNMDEPRDCPVCIVGFFGPCGMWNLSSPTRDQIHAMEALSLDHWATGEVRAISSY